MLITVRMQVSLHSVHMFEIGLELKGLAMVHFRYFVIEFGPPCLDFLSPHLLISMTVFLSSLIANFQYDNLIPTCYIIHI